MKEEQILKRIKTIKFTPFAGDHIDEIKQAVSEFCQKYHCFGEFTHNGDTYICDHEGAIAKSKDWL